VGTFGNVWEPLGTCGNLWERVGTFGNVREPLGTCENLWEPLPLSRRVSPAPTPMRVVYKPYAN